MGPIIYILKMPKKLILDRSWSLLKNSSIILLMKLINKIDVIIAMAIDECINDDAQYHIAVAIYM